MKTQRGETAIVIGGSMAGLLAARVLSDFFPQVMLLERDSLPDSAQPRKGVPQGQHAHALLGQGRQILETFFPGLTETLVAQGAPLGKGRFFSGGGYFCRVPHAPATLYVSRPCLENEVRRRVLALPEVRLLDTCDVLGLIGSRDQHHVTGVRVIRRHADAAAETLTADLVVDASGRGSRLSAWLEQLGYAKPEVELVEVGMGYATRFYQRRSTDLDGDLMVNISAMPENRRACGMLAQEGDRWIVTLAGYFGDHPPLDEAGYLAFAQKLPTPDVYDFLRTATPLNDPVAFKFPSNQRRRFERLESFPSGLLVIGDAICSFTPIYGQGMSVAAMEAVILQSVLAQHAINLELTQSYFARVSKTIDIPWNITVGNDRNLSTETNQRPLPARWLSWYLSKLQLGARRDPALALAFFRVGNLFASPTSLLKPAIVIRVFGNMVVRRLNALSLRRTPKLTSPQSNIPVP